MEDHGVPMFPQILATQEDVGRGSGGRHSGRRGELMQAPDIRTRREAVTNRSPEAPRERAREDDVTGSLVWVVTNGAERFPHLQDTLLEQVTSRRDPGPGQQPGEELHTGGGGAKFAQTKSW
jgi:hypothetical protein